MTTGNSDQQLYAKLAYYTLEHTDPALSTKKSAGKEKTDLTDSV